MDFEHAEENGDVIPHMVKYKGKLERLRTAKVSEVSGGFYWGIFMEGCVILHSKKSFTTFGEAMRGLTTELAYLELGS